MNLGEALVAVVDSSVKVITVDVFDTVLLRNWKPEIYRFWEAAARHEEVLRALGGAPSRRALFASRLTCHPLAYRIASSSLRTRDPSVEEVIQLITTDLRLALQPEARDALLRAELEYEMDNLEANEPLVNALADLKSRRPALRLLYLSDMYLRAAHVESLLMAKGARMLFDGGYVSSDNRCTKAAGDLYRLLLEREEVSPAQILHVGDNPTSDHSSPGRLGIRSVLVQRPMALRVLRSVAGHVFRRWWLAQAKRV